MLGHSGYDPSWCPKRTAAAVSLRRQTPALQKHLQVEQPAAPGVMTLKRCNLYPYRLQQQQELRSLVAAPLAVASRSVLAELQESSPASLLCFAHCDTTSAVAMLSPALDLAGRWSGHWRCKCRSAWTSLCSHAAQSDVVRRQTSRLMSVQPAGKE